MITLDERVILWLAVEEYAELWEVVWQLRSLRPRDSEADLGQVATTVVAGLLQRGWVNLYRCEEPYGELFEIPRDEAEGLLADEASWCEPAAEKVSIRIGATASGEEVYRQWRI